MNGCSVGFIAYTVADFTLFVVVAVIDLILVGLFAFFSVNGVPFHFFALNVLQTLRSPSLRVWDKAVTLRDIKMNKQKTTEEKKMDEVRSTRRPTHSSLTELSLVVDTGGTYRGEKAYAE